MVLGGLTGGFYRISEWIMRLAYLNLLWIMFSLVGLIVFGLAPATASMFVVIRKWLMGDVDIPIFKTFWSSYKLDFFKVNILGLTMVTIGYVLYIDIKFFHAFNDSWLAYLFVPILALSVIYFLMLLYILPVFVHYKIKLFQVVKNSFFIMMMNPVATILMIIGCTVIYYIMMFIPGLIVFFGGSSLAFLIMWCSQLAFNKVQKKQAVIED